VVERKGRGRTTLATLILSDTETKGESESESGTKSECGKPFRGEIIIL
jgi:hypothetical protein